MRCPVCSTPMVHVTPEEPKMCDNCHTLKKAKEFEGMSCPKCDYFMCKTCTTDFAGLVGLDDDLTDEMYPEEFEDEEEELS